MRRRSPARRALTVMTTTVAVLAGLVVAAPAQADPAGAMVGDAGCSSVSLSVSDDGSGPQVVLPFTVNLGATPRTSVYVNNNGNMTFDSAMSTFSPAPMSSFPAPVVAPYFADVDTRGAGQVSYGMTTYEGRTAFCATWTGVGYYNAQTNKLNTFQVILADRSDVAAGDVDLVFNYGSIQWETGSASGGANGLGGLSARVGWGYSGNGYEMPGSGVNGALLDSNPTTGLIHSSRNSPVLGRYVFKVRGGSIDATGSISGTVTDATSAAVEGAQVWACPATSPTPPACVTSTTDSTGHYVLPGVLDANYRVTVRPAAPLVERVDDVRVVGDVVHDVTLAGAVAPPAGSGITPASNAGGPTRVSADDDLHLWTTACPGGTGTYEIRGAGTIATGALTEGAPGLYSATVPPLRPSFGPATVTTTVDCGGGPQVVAYDLYIDPSGVVVDVSDAPISGARVTLLRSDASGGPFTAVPDQSPLMSVANRNNPQTTGADGSFGWDVVPGYYLVRAQRSGCHAPGDPALDHVDSPVLAVPPDAVGLKLVLECPTAVGSPRTSVDRIAGADRFVTSAAISAATFAPGAARAYVATGDTFPDALTGAAVAGGQRVPVLLVRSGSIPAAVAAELDRLDPREIVVLGGPAAVSAAVERSLRAYTAGSVTRVSGSDRFETAANLAEGVFGGPVENVFVATGSSFPDALSGAAAAGAARVPVLLVDGDAVPATTRAELVRLAPKRITVLGGEAAVSASVVTALKVLAPTVDRWAGTDRYGTSVVVSSKAFPTATRALFATGEAFADALSGASVAAGVPGPMLLSRPQCVPAPVTAEIGRLGVTSVTLLGGTSALGVGVASLTTCTP